MSDSLSIQSFNRTARVEEGNRFLIGNGHLGYRGVLEEENKESMKGLNLVGVYDRYKDKWRESLNLPDPIFFRTYVNGKEETVNTIDPLKHSLKLDLEHGLLNRESEFPSYLIKTERFLSKTRDNLLAASITIEAKETNEFRFVFGLDTDIYEINGPHFAEKILKDENGLLLFKGTTNEGKNVYEAANYSINKGTISFHEGFYETDVSLKKGEKFELKIFSLIFEEETDFSKKIDEVTENGYENEKKAHIDRFSSLFNEAKINLLGDNEGEFELSYAIYELLILGDENRARSIPARGVSGQTYKGAVFWDTEIFLLPFFALNEPEVARNLILYRVNTLSGAKAKAKEFGYDGAFYSWESQDSGLEACSKYNVTDYKTGKPIRTYFNEKQIHISADIPYAIENYIKITGDQSILKEGALNVLIECALFFVSYAKKRKDGLYHIDDVIGPDEYHERVNDNAFTNYMVNHAIRFTIEMMKGHEDIENYDQINSKLNEFVSNLYLPKPNENGVIEQFEGYFKKEDCSLETVRSRVKDPKQYWGGKDGPASGTQIIKQADVIALLALLSDEFPLSIKKANYDYYFPRTEHGSSLSSSMYSLLATEINEKEYAYSMFRKSASIDLYGPQKLYAGGIYIGGTHPASAGGAYLSAVYGFSGLKIDRNGNISCSNHLPKEIKELSYKIKVRNKTYNVLVNKKEAKVEEIDND